MLSPQKKLNVNQLKNGKLDSHLKGDGVFAQQPHFVEVLMDKNLEKKCPSQEIGEWK